jgi:hypothetical protein
VYNNTQAAKRASSKLTIIHQGNKLFIVFLAEFNRMTLKAGRLTWTDQVKKIFLNNYLLKELKTALVPITAPIVYCDYCSLLYIISNKLEALWKDDKYYTTP